MPTCQTRATLGSLSICMLRGRSCRSDDVPPDMDVEEEAKSEEEEEEEEDELESEPDTELWPEDTDALAPQGESGKTVSEDETDEAYGSMSQGRGALRKGDAQGASLPHVRRR